jgi:hypothetical protein
MKTMWTTAKRLARKTPVERDRYIDFLRLFAIVVVVLGHWLMAVIVVRDGDVEVDHLLALAPGAQYLTWILQVMPVFFIVGGFANAMSWSSSQRVGRRYSEWLQSRTTRLLRPTTVFATVWAGATLLLMTMGVDPATLRMATQAVAVPLWFLAVYLGIVALAPLMIRLDRRYGWSVPLSLASAALVVDYLHHGIGVPVVGWSNFLFVWLAVHQIGILWQRGALPRGISGNLAVAAAGLVGLYLLTVIGPYPTSMVGVPGSAWTNNLPPTVALIVLAVVQTGVMLVLRRPVTAWLQRPSMWAVVVAGNGRIMTIYLWHMTAMITVAGFGLLAGGSGLAINPLTGTWWWSRLIWIAVLLVPLAGLTSLFGSFEANRVAHPATNTAVVVGVMVVIWGFARLALGGFVATDSATVGFLAPLAVLLGAWLLGITTLGRAHGGVGSTPS